MTRKEERARAPENSSDLVARLMGGEAERAKQPPLFRRRMQPGVVFDGPVRNRAAFRFSNGHYIGLALAKCRALSRLRSRLAAWHVNRK